MELEHRNIETEGGHHLPRLGAVHYGIGPEETEPLDFLQASPDLPHRPMESKEISHAHCRTPPLPQSRCVEIDEGDLRAAIHGGGEEEFSQAEMGMADLAVVEGPDRQPITNARVMPLLVVVPDSHPGETHRIWRPKWRPSGRHFRSYQAWALKLHVTGAGLGRERD